MKKWTKAIIADVALAILAIFLFSPTQLALSPLAPNILVAAASVISAAGIGAAAVKVNGDAIKAIRGGRGELGLVRHLLRAAQDRLVPVKVDGDVFWGLSRTADGCLALDLDTAAVPDTATMFWELAR